VLVPHLFEQTLRSKCATVGSQEGLEHAEFLGGELELDGVTGRAVSHRIELDAASAENLAPSFRLTTGKRA
jgi:hypothetical protein